MPSRIKTVLLTGATGLLGHYVATLAPSHWRLISIGRNPPARIAPNIEHLSINLASPAFIDLLPSHVDTVIHLAQSRRFREFPQGAADVFAINTMSTAWLLDYAVKSGCQEFIYASTGSVYRPSTLLTESSSTLNFDETQLYPASKLAAEAILGAYSKSLRVALMRIFFMYGPGQHESMLIPRLIRLIRQGKPISLSGPDGFHFNPLYAEDAASLVWSIIDSDFSGLLNVAGPEELNLREVCKLIGDEIGSTPIFEKASGIPTDFRVDLTKLENLFGAMPTRFEVGIRKMIQLIT
ncbi:MAG: NAD-dependent epimerase/dehydratase family protein [Betaproteobacteria bacterium]